MRCRSSIAIISGLLSLLGTTFAIAQPVYEFDASWPKVPLPSKWWMQGVTGLYVDHDDNIWVLNRPNNLDNTENYAAVDPPLAECCIAPPAIIVFDREGNVINSWETEQGHGLTVDRDGYVWIGQSTVRKYTSDGDLVAEIGRIPEERPPEGKYPPETEVIVGGLEEIRVDEQADEVYVVDNHFNGRVLVFDRDTLEFKRGWGAYGKPLSEIREAPAYDRENPAGPDFFGHVTLDLSNDGLVYVADRRGNRIQVLSKQGEFIKEFFLATYTLQRGSTGGIAFSSDPAQRYLLIPDIQNNTIHILNREDGVEIGRVGSPGNNGGQFHGLHMLDVDSDGNLYTGEVQAGERVQRFLLVDE